MRVGAGQRRYWSGWGRYESGLSLEFVARDNWSISGMLQQIEVDGKRPMSKTRAGERGWTFGPGAANRASLTGGENAKRRRPSG